MTDLEQQISKLSKTITGLESRLAELSGQLAEMRYLIAPFLVRYQQEVLDYHAELVEVRRQIADIRLMMGDSGAREAGATETSLSRLIVSDEYLPVEEQYKRVWGGKKVLKPRDMWQKTRLAPPSAEVKELYAEIVAQLHPGLAESAEDQQRNRAIMQQVDIAYARRDRRTLNSVAEARRSRRSLPMVVDEKAVDHLRERATKLEALNAALEGQIFELEHGDAAKVMALAFQAQQHDYDLLKSLSTELQSELSEAQQKLTTLKSLL